MIQRIRPIRSVSAAATSGGMSVGTEAGGLGFGFLFSVDIVLPSSCLASGSGFPAVILAGKAQGVML
ncbi:MAG: hypothetical protein P8020_03800 [Acidobacteriota bacterium]